MIGSLDYNQKHAVILGGGLAGLLMAYRLAQLDFEVEVLESSERFGGLIETAETSFGLAEKAAHTVRVTPKMHQFLNEIGVEMTPTRTNRKYVLRGGKPRMIPLNPFEGLGCMWRMFMKLSPGGSNSIADWALHHLGQAALDHAVTPMCHGIYAAPPENLSITAAFPSLAPAPSQSLAGKIKEVQASHKGRARVMAPLKGMEDIITQLLKKLEGFPNVTLKMGQKIAHLPDAPNIILCSPMNSVGKLLKDESLAHHPYVPLIAATVFVEKQKNFLEGIGVLHSRGENVKSLGILFNSSSFAGRVKDEDKVASFTLMMGGYGNEDILNLSDGQLYTLCEEELQRILNIRTKPLQVIPARWSRALPLYSRELESHWQNLKDGWCATPGRVVFANWSGSISLRGMVESVMDL